MLDCEHARGERLGAVVFADRDGCLRDDRAGIGIRNDEVNGRAGNLHPGLERLPMRIEAAERRQEGRVDVDHPASPVLRERRREQSHESAETHELDALLVEGVLQQALEGRPILSVRTMVDDHGRNSFRRGAREPGGLRSIGDDQRDLGRVRRGFRRLDQRGHVRAAPGDQHGDAFPDHHSPGDRLVIGHVCDIRRA